MNAMLEGRQVLIVGPVGRLASLICDALAAKGANVRLVADWSDASTGQLVEAEFDIVVVADGMDERHPKPFTKLTDHDWREVCERVVLESVRVVRHVMPSMLLQNKGCIVFIVQGATEDAPWNQIHIEMAAAARLAIARSLAELTTGTAVSVAAVHVGGSSSPASGTPLASMKLTSGAAEEEVVMRLLDLVRDPPGSD